MNHQETFLQIVRLGIGHYVGRVTGEIDWNEMQALAEQQGLSAVVMDGVEKLPETQRPPKITLLQWIGEVLQNYEQRYELYRKSIAELAGWHNVHGYKMMVLKGYACGLNWPKPGHRPYGDIDIWQFGQQKEVDAALEQEKGTKIDNSHHHHSVFYWLDFMVENHYDFFNTKDLKSNKEMESVIKELGQDDSYTIELCGEKVYLPSPNLHALFLLRHTLLHFVSTSMNLRQILDWGFFVKAHGNEVDWEWFIDLLEKYHMKDFFNLINAICVEDLGFPVRIFPEVQFVPELKERVLSDILNPKYTAAEPKRFLPRVIYKYKRWQGNAWKQELCYSESRWSAFWSGVWGHLLKPKSI